MPGGDEDAGGETNAIRESNVAEFDLARAGELAINRIERHHISNCKAAPAAGKATDRNAVAVLMKAGVSGFCRG